MQLSPQLVFNGNCAEAIAFYESALGAKAAYVSRYGDAPADHGYVTPPEIAPLILHAKLDLHGIQIFVCDSPPQQPYTVGNNICIALMFDTKEAVQAAYDALQEGGTVALALQKTFWSECFGMVTDRYGFTWQLTVQD